MMILQDIHTYLVISFLLTGWLVFKFFYKKFDNAISKDINDVRDLLADLEEQKASLERQLLETKAKLTDAENHKQQAISEAKVEAKTVEKCSIASAANAVVKKQAELDEVLARMQTGFSNELRNKLLDATMAALLQKVDAAKGDVNFQEASINNSINALKALSKSV
ncbi:MAG: hypothetical protein IJT08_03490 [Alphaproteobacteria bacterium]|nr:hypothetical protein [Alphaproteobacteria bacterium]